MPKVWTDDEITTLRIMYERGAEYGEIGAALKRTVGSVKCAINEQKQSYGLKRQPISQPMTAVLNDMVTVEGDALILPDVEAPYHHADFINRCIDLALRWNIKQCILAGDYAHLSNFSQWGESVTPEKPTEINDPDVAQLLQWIPKDKQERAKRTLLEKTRPAYVDENITSELASVRQTSREIGGAFADVYYLMGNHDDRPLRMINRAEPVGGLLGFIGAGKDWHLTSNYHCQLITENPVPFRITHPDGAGPNMAIDLAIQYHCHVLMGHSHRWAVQRDPSGDYWAIQMGHCVDEKRRLSYVTRRDKKRTAHALGAVIVRGGYPFVLCESFPFSSA